MTVFVPAIFCKKSQDYKTDREIELEKKLEIAVKALEKITVSKGDEDTEDCKIPGYLYISHCLKMIRIAQKALAKIKEIK